MGLLLASGLAVVLFGPLLAMRLSESHRRWAWAVGVVSVVVFGLLLYWAIGPCEEQDWTLWGEAMC